MFDFQNIGPLAAFRTQSTAVHDAFLYRATLHSPTGCCLYVLHSGITIGNLTFLFVVR